MGLTVERAELAALRDEWVALLDRQAEPLPFVHPAWQQVWLERFLDGREALLLAVRDGSTLAGVAPLLRSDGRVSFAGNHKICDYMDFLAEPDRVGEVWSALLAALEEHDWSSLELRGVREDSPTAAELSRVAEAAGLTVDREDEAVAPGIDLPASWDEYLASLSKKDRHELRRKLRRLQSAGEVSLQVYTAADDVEARLPVLLRLMVESRADKATFMSEEMGAFFHRAARALASEGLVRLYELELDGQTVASVLCFDQGGRLFMYNSGYDPAYRSLAVGLGSKALCVREAIESGYRRVDLLRGSEAYKYHLGGKDRKVYRYVMERTKR